MRRGKRVETIELPFVDPEIVTYTITENPIEFPLPYEPAVPLPQPEPNRVEQRP